MSLKVEFLFRIDGGYHKDAGVDTLWQTLGIPFELTVTHIGQPTSFRPRPFQGTRHAGCEGALAPEPPRATRNQPEPRERGARRRRALARRRRAPTGSDQSHEDVANRVQIGECCTYDTPLLPHFP